MTFNSCIHTFRLKSLTIDTVRPSTCEIARRRVSTTTTDVRTHTVTLIDVVYHLCLSVCLSVCVSLCGCVAGGVCCLIERTSSTTTLSSWSGRLCFRSTPLSGRRTSTSIRSHPASHGPPTTSTRFYRSDLLIDLDRIISN